MNGQRVFRRITVNELGAWLAQHPDALLLDARDTASHARDGWPGSLRLSHDNQDDLLLRVSRRRPILIYCYRGNASRTLARMFADFGFTEVCDLIGGYAAWAANTSAASPAGCPVDAALAGRLDRQGSSGLEGRTLHDNTPPRAARDTRTVGFDTARVHAWAGPGANVDADRAPQSPGSRGATTNECTTLTD